MAKRTNSKRRRKNASQVAKGKMRAGKAKRDGKGKFIKDGIDPAETPAGIPPESPAPDPAQGPAQSPAYITTTTIPDGEKKKEREKRPFEQYVDKAMEDDIWREMIIMKTGLPLEEKRKEIAERFKIHVIIMGKENAILSENDAKNYFMNYTRKGTKTYKELIQEIRQQAAENQEEKYRYEDIDPKTGERSYYGIPIPKEAPPRPNENAVWLNGLWTV